MRVIKTQRAYTIQKKKAFKCKNTTFKHTVSSCELPFYAIVAGLTECGGVQRCCLFGVCSSKRTAKLHELPVVIHLRHDIRIRVQLHHRDMLLILTHKNNCWLLTPLAAYSIGLLIITLCNKKRL